MKNKKEKSDVPQLNLHDFLTMGQSLPLKQRAAFFYRYRQNLKMKKQDLYLRPILSAADREVEVLDPYSGRLKKMLMFGSNNYLGFANHPYVLESIRKALRKFGAGIGGPPLLNGYTALHRQLEERLARLKHHDDALIFPTGYAANLGLVCALGGENDRFIYDAYCHASFRDGIRLFGKQAQKFSHNNLEELKQLLQERAATSGDTFVAVEGVYSMDGDLAPLNEITELCRRFGATLIVDDAHGTGVLGQKGSGTAEHFGLSGAIDLDMGTFSKTFALTGGFVAGDKELVHYLRFFARSYMFSASLPPTVIAAVIAGLDLLKSEPWRRQQLHANVAYVAAGLRQLGFDVQPQAAIIALRVPLGMNIRQAAFEFHRLGIFVNSVEYPAVPLNEQRFRISLMATHTKSDLDRLLEAVHQVWSKFGSGREAERKNESAEKSAEVI